VAGWEAPVKRVVNVWFYKGEGFLDHPSDCQRSGSILLCVVGETSTLTLRESDGVEYDKDSIGT
jgi:hypothetical protein